MLGVANVVQRAVERRSEPLVGVEYDRVGSFHSFPHPPALGQDHRRAGHRGIDVQPKAVPRRDVRDSRLPDRARSRRSCRSSRQRHRVVCRSRCRPRTSSSRRRAASRSHRRAARRGRSRGRTPPAARPSRLNCDSALRRRPTSGLASACNPPRASEKFVDRSRAQSRAIRFAVEAVS